MARIGLAALVLLACLLSSARAFYLPGVAPQDYKMSEELQMKVNKLSSVKTQLPYEYYTLPYCKPDKVVHSVENLGEVIRGDRIENSVYSVRPAPHSPAARRRHRGARGTQIPGGGRPACAPPPPRSPTAGARATALCARAERRRARLPPTRMRAARAAVRD